MKHAIDKIVLSVNGLLNLTDIAIPTYQRSYSHTKNSRLSNFQPKQKQKQEHFEASLTHNEIGSLKLLAMIELMKKNNQWGEEEIAVHEAEMLAVLTNASSSDSVLWRCYE